MRIQATNKATGEVIDLPADTPEAIVQAWQIAQEYSKVATALKDQLKPIVPALLDEQDNSPPIGKFRFRRTINQRMTYDKSVLRQVFDEDTLDLFLEVKRKAVDNYVKEHPEDIDPMAVYELRKGLVPSGDTFEVIKLERLER